MPSRTSSSNSAAEVLVIFQEASHSLTRCLDDAFARVGIPHNQFQVLVALRHNPGIVTPMSIANWLDRNPNTITLIIDRMERDGLVQRVRDLKDRRAIRLAITPKGEEIYRKAMKPAIRLPQEILSILSKEELSTFARLLINIREKTYDYRGIKDKVTERSFRNIEQEERDMK